MADMTRSYRSRARRLVINQGRMTPTQIYEKIGKPPEGTRLKADGRGNVTTEQVSNRRARRNRANAKRSADAKMSRPTLTPKEKKAKTKLEKQRTQERAQGKDTEIKHVNRPSLTGPQLKRLKGSNRTDKRNRLEKAYGRLGDSSENLELGSGAENRQEEIDYQDMQRGLEDMEKKHPSDPTNPSADYIETEENGNGVNGHAYVNGDNGNSNGNGNGNGNGNPAFQSRYAQDSYQHAQDSLKLIGTVGAVGLNVLSVLKALNPLQFNP